MSGHTWQLLTGDHVPYLLCDTLQGLVSGAVAERLGGVGALCCLGTGSKPPPLTVLYQMNLAPGAKAAVSTTQLADLLAAAQVGEGRAGAGGTCTGQGRGRARQKERTGRQRGASLVVWHSLWWAQAVLLLSVL